MKRADLIASLDIGTTIKKIREDRGLSQEELAEGICDRSNLTKLENGHYKIPSLSFILLICDKLEITIEEFLKLAMDKKLILDKETIFTYLLNDEYSKAKEYIDAIDTSLLSVKDKRLVSLFYGLISLNNNHLNEARHHLKQAISKNFENDVISMIVHTKLATNEELLKINHAMKSIPLDGIEYLYLVHTLFNRFIDFDMYHANIYLRTQLEYINLHEEYKYLTNYYKNKLLLYERNNKNTDRILKNLEIIKLKNK